MTLRQRLLKIIYPLWMWYGKIRGRNNLVLKGAKTPPVSFYDLQFTMNNGQPFKFDQLRGKKVLIVNTASDCGYTDQYDDLEALYKQYQEKLVILGFPSNDFKDQEKGTDAEIAEFCRINYGVTFPLMKKSSVKKSAEQNEIYTWLTDPLKNGWNSKQPSWNFCKYLVDESGKLRNYFGSTISPSGREIIKAINEQ